MMLIAPATANSVAKLAAGMADNLLTVTALAARCPVILAPAMDGGMWDHPATQANVQVLQNRGVMLAGPATGRMASGLEGMGRMIEPQELLGHARLALSRGGPMAGRSVVVIRSAHICASSARRRRYFARLYALSVSSLGTWASMKSMTNRSAGYASFMTVENVVRQPCGTWR